MGNRIISSGWKVFIAKILVIILVFCCVPANKVFAADRFLTGIEIISQPKVLEYTVGDVFSTKGLKIAANYSDGSYVYIQNNELEVEYDFSEKGNKKVEISYSENSIKKSVNLNVDVYEKPGLSSDKLKGKVGEIIEVPVSITNNPGLMGIKIVVSYNEELLKPIEVSDTDIFDSGFVNDNIATSTDNSFFVIWNGTEELKTNGKLFVAKFLCIKNPVNGKTEISVQAERRDTYTDKYNTIAVENGKSIITYDSIKNVNVNYSSVSIRKGTKYQLIADTYPENSEVVWSSGDNSVVTVDSMGKISAVGVGNTKIIVCLKDDEDIKSECLVNVLDGENVEHDHEWKDIDIKKADCEEDGSVAHYCTICGESYTEVVKKLGHEFGEYISDNNASCMKDGTKTAKCSRCKKTDTIVDVGSNKGGHKWSQYYTYKKATCTDKEILKRTCSVCNGEETKEGDSLGHIEVIDEAQVATCEQEGKTEGKHCERCNEIIVPQYSVPAKNHKWDDGKVTKEPTAKEAGEFTFRCRNCNAEKIVVIPATGKEINNKENNNTDDDSKPTEQKSSEQDKTKDNSQTQKTVKVSGVGTISADGKTLTDTDGVKYLVADKLANSNLKKSISVADKKSAGKYKITKITKKNGKVIGGTVTYMKPYNKNCKKANIKATIVIAGAKFKVTALAKNAFKNCKKITFVNIGKNIKTIGANAFYGCKKLKTITIKTKVLSKVGKKAFKGIKSKATFVIPKKLTAKKVTKYNKLIKKAGTPKKYKVTKK